MKLKPIKTVTKAKINPIAIMKERRAFHEKESLADKLTDDLERTGVDFFKPSEMGGSLNLDSRYLTLPKDITETVSRDLGQHLNVFTQQKIYMRTLIGWQEIYTDELKRKYYEVSQPKYAELSKTKMSETAKEREINSDSEIGDHFFQYKDSKRKMDLLHLNLASIEDAIFLLSREISRRTSDWDTENRNHNVGRK